MSTTLSKDYKERIVPELTEEFKYTTVMQVPRLEKIVINQGLGAATQDKKIIETAINELTAITGQKAVATLSRKDISNFKLRKKMPIGAMVTLRRPRQLYARHHGADHFPRDQHRQCSETSGYEHHLRYIGQDR